MKKTPGRLTTLVLTLAVLFLLAASSAAEVVDRIVAVVDNEVITMSELEQMTKSFLMQSGISAKSRDAQTLKRQLLDALIDQKLAKAEAKRRGIEPAPKDIDQALDQLKKRNHLPDDAALNQALDKANLTLAELKQQISDKLLQERLLATVAGAKGSVSDADVRRFYDQQVKNSGNQVHLRALRIPLPAGATQAQKDEAQKKAEAMLREAQQGVPMKDLAAKFEATEIDMGFLSQGDLDPQLTDLVNREKVGGIVPVQSPDGFQLIQLVDRRSGQPLSFEEAAPRIREMLLQKDREKHFSEWVKTLREKALIKIMY